MATTESLTSLVRLPRQYPRYENGLHHFDLSGFFGLSLPAPINIYFDIRVDAVFHRAS